MELGIENKIALVTGSSRGIGKSCALSLAREGVKVVICGRNQNTLDNTLKEIVNLAHRYPISITNEQGILNLYFQKKVDTYIELPEYLDDYIIYFYVEF